MTTKPEGPAQEPLNVGGETKCKNCEQPKSGHLASGHIYCPISLGRACWYEPVVPATSAPSQPAAREWRFSHPDRPDDIDEMLEAYATYRLAKQTAALRAAILDIDAHATPLGHDADGFVTGGYQISVGALHRALGLIGHSSAKCKDVPCDRAEAAERERDSLREANARLAADLDAALKAGRKMKMDYDIEAISAAVHDAWMENKRKAGVSSRKLESGEELMVPYGQLSETAKELDRGSVRAVVAAIEQVNRHAR